MQGGNNTTLNSERVKQKVSTVYFLIANMKKKFVEKKNIYCTKRKIQKKKNTIYKKMK